MPTFNSFTITQPFLGAPLQFQPALGSKELEELVDLYVVGNACKQDKLSTLTIDFYNNATVDINTGSLVRRYDVMPWSFELSPSQSQSSGLSPPLFTPSPASSATLADSAYGSTSTPPNRTRGSRISKKSKKDTKKSAEVRLPGFSIMTKDGIDVTNSAGRGTKTKEQREHAHLMRIIKACDECKRKKIRCDPSHRRSSNTDMSRTSASFKPSPPSKSNPSPAASTPSLSRETTQDSEKSSTPVELFAMEDFVLFPEDGFNHWNPEMSTPGFNTQYSDFSMTNYDTFPDFDTSFSTLNDNSSFDFLSFDQSSSFSTQSFNASGHMPNHYNTQSIADVDVNSQYISPTQGESDLDLFDSFGDLQNFSPTHTQQTHPQAVANEDPGKIDNFIHAPVSRSQAHSLPLGSPVSSNVISQANNEITLQDFSTAFNFSQTDYCHQPLVPNIGLDGAYHHATGSVVDSGAGLSPQSQTRHSEPSDRDIESAVMNSMSRRRRSERKKHQVLLERECRRIESHDLELVNDFLSGNGEPHVPGASAGRPASSPGIFHGGDGFPMNTNNSRSFVSSSSPVHEKTPWSFESTVSSLAKSSPEVLGNTVESDQGILTVVKPRERPGALARLSSSTIIDASLGRTVRTVGDHISSRLVNFATSSSDQQVLGAGADLLPTQLAVSSSTSNLRSRTVVDTTPRAMPGEVTTRVLFVPNRVKTISSPDFVLLGKLDSKISSSLSNKFIVGSSNSKGFKSLISTAQDSSAALMSSPSLSINDLAQASTVIRDGAKPAVAPATATMMTTLYTISTLATLAFVLATTAAVSKYLDFSTAAIVLYLVVPISCTSQTTTSGSNKSLTSTFISASMQNFWSNMQAMMIREHQGKFKEKDHTWCNLDVEDLFSMPILVLGFHFLMLGWFLGR
ncbi:hypothetical protein EYC80_009077 [Monilinia laxa]|uniref:Zn(2)-C6 fungal-type domain-containing protein n=1 Tax=Monilinia laxa TaxID=61186 RepID=A0A5N6K2C0_MONLA|nr:hypothetical protein EYC80_009077 [Monilinia laxa]